MNINGSIALVTGANRGIGKAFAEALLERGAAKVYAGVRDPSTITDPRLTPVRLDVTDHDRVAAVAHELGDVQIVVNNAGGGVPSLPLTTEIEDARSMLELNYLSLVAMTQSFAPVLAANGGGAFVNMLSIVSFAPTLVLTGYSASKAAAWNYSNASRVALSAQGTHVVGVHVGLVDTDLVKSFPGDKVTPESVAAAGLDALESGAPEALVDERTRELKAGLSDDQNTIYPELAKSFLAAAA